MLYNIGIKRVPRDSLAFLGLGIANCLKNLPVKGLHQISMALAKNYCSNQINEEYILYNRAVAYIRLGMDKYGIKDIERAIYFDPNNILILNFRRTILRRLGMYSECVKEELNMVSLSVKESENKTPAAKPLGAKLANR